MEKYLTACKTKCKSQFCPDCSLAHCVSWREKLRPALSHWDSVLMLTLTVDPAKFESPEAALRHVGEKRKISELIRALVRKGLLKNREFTCTLEFHKPEKGGWPHWHILVESKFIDKHKLQNCWGLGHVWLSKHDFKSVDHAINYATKYIVKTNDDKANDEFIFPEWAMDYKGNLRRFSTSRGLCKTRKFKKRTSSEGEKKRERKTRTGREKIKL